MPFNIGWTGLILIVLIGLLLFGPSKLPQLGRAIGDTMREFRKGSRQMIQEAEAENVVDVKPQAERKSVN
ncbi:twin-arginine translocase TatA/TatE family subunit [Paenibacillus flagellatus]|uniref:Sec-independent protein translocase protein TatA n=1 Tax=Paenibacillus flagellatus TaxID=2211139 RepID=A0A2V5K7M6_9BACL|nr:twin-arginine translocase TatA/TatE family subunit [Paenibacillus flagellatus]PYI55449.1 twin-arginine translocase TatA/TatE family subunit [Paenibacillus flagellatus]